MEGDPSFQAVLNLHLPFPSWNLHLKMKYFGGPILLSGNKTARILKYIGNVFKRKILFSFWLLLE